MKSDQILSFLFLALCVVCILGFNYIAQYKPDFSTLGGYFIFIGLGIIGFFLVVGIVNFFLIFVALIIWPDN